MFSTPVTISKSTPPMIISSETRSSTLAADRAGGQVNSRGMTDHSLASTSGIMISPRPTCRPWFRRYSHFGLLGQSNEKTLSQPTSPGMACPNFGP